MIRYFIQIWSDPVWSKVIAAAITSMAAALYGISKLIRRKPRTRTVFQNELVMPYYFQEKKGGGARGATSIEDGLITIQRTNINDSISLRVKRYLDGANMTDYVKNNKKGISMRVFMVSAECRIIGGMHRLGVAALRKDGSVITSEEADVWNEEWQRVEIYLRDIPATEDFIIEFEDSQVERANSSIQLRNIKIEEIIS